MTEVASVVFVVDDDPSIRRAIKRLVESVGLRVEGLGSAQEFLRSQRPDAPSCLVLDVRLPGISGRDFQRELREANIHIPIIFITAHGDIPMTVPAMKAGAVEFLTKPFRDQELLDAIQEGLERDPARRAQEAPELLPWVVSGLLNKQIADAIEASETTVKAHRSRLMRKMDASSMADLVRMTLTHPELQPRWRRESSTSPDFSMVERRWRSGTLSKFRNKWKRRRSIDPDALGILRMDLGDSREPRHSQCRVCRA
jgi:FixJ family two-component response regulator